MRNLQGTDCVENSLGLILHVRDTWLQLQFLSLNDSSPDGFAGESSTLHNTLTSMFGLVFAEALMHSPAFTT